MTVQSVLQVNPPDLPRKTQAYVRLAEKLVSHRNESSRFAPTGVAWPPASPVARPQRAVVDSLDP